MRSIVKLDRDLVVGFFVIVVTVIAVDDEPVTNPGIAGMLSPISRPPNQEKGKEEGAEENGC